MDMEKIQMQTIRAHALTQAIHERAEQMQSTDGLTLDNAGVLLTLAEMAEQELESLKTHLHRTV